MVMISELAARQPNSAQGAELVMTIASLSDIRATSAVAR